jgi:hypothetical protein
MSYKIRRVDYFYVTVKDRPGQAYQILEQIAGLGVNMLAFAATPTGPDDTQLTIFPEDSLKLQSVAKKSGLSLIGPHSAFLVQGEDELGGLVEFHKRLYQAGVNIYGSHGVTDGKGSYGYVVYVRAERYERAAEALGI